MSPLIGWPLNASPSAVQSLSVAGLEVEVERLAVGAEGKHAGIIRLRVGLLSGNEKGEGEEERIHSELRGLLIAWDLDS